MHAELVAVLALAAYAVAAAAVATWLARRGDRSVVARGLYALACVFSRLYHRCRVNRPCPFPASGRALIVANHRSPVDPIYLWANHHLGNPKRRWRIISFMMAREYYEQRLFRRLLDAVQAIPVERDGRDMAALKQALRRLKAGGLVAVFPEGRLNLESPDKLLPAGSGVAWLALRAEAPVYPVFIHNSPGGQHMLEPFLRPARVRLTYGEPIDLSAFYGRKYTHAVLKQATDEIMRQLAELGGIAFSETELEEQKITIPIRPAAG